MSYREEIPAGLVGLHPRQPIGCHINVAIKGKNGAPAYKGRFWLTQQLTHAQEFTTGSGKAYRQLARDLHPSFVAWNDEALALGSDVSRKGPGRIGVLRGNIVHARFEDAVLFNRAAQKLPEGHPNPPSRRPACEGNGIWALRYQGGQGAEERFDRIACPNRECIFAQQGLCKVSAHLIFRLRWNPADAWEAQFPALLAEWNTRGFESAENMLGLFEMVLGTAALLTPEQRELATEEERAKWRTGLAAEMGVANPSLVGLPFTMTVGDKTKAADASSASGKRYPVVTFSPDGDLVDWLLIQGQRRRELAGAPQRAALPPASTRDGDFLATVRHESRTEIDPSAVIEVAATPAPTGPVQVASDLKTPERLPTNPTASVDELRALMKAHLPGESTGSDKTREALQGAFAEPSWVKVTLMAKNDPAAFAVGLNTLRANLEGLQAMREPGEDAEAEP